MASEPRLTVATLFQAATLSPSGPVAWGEPCTEERPGVYVVEIDRQIVYVGRTRRALSRRIREFYRHKYGDSRPHRGGQALLKHARRSSRVLVRSDDPRDAEEKMIRSFEERCGRIPIANRRRGDRARVE